MTFGRPELLALLAGVPAVAALVIWAHRKRSSTLLSLLSVSALADLVPARALRSRGVQAVLAVVTALALAVAAARPQFGFDWVQRRAKGVNLVVVLDVSRSMDAADASPSRLEQARREILDLLVLLRGDSVGLVLVANGGYLRLPLTTDYGTFAWALQDTSTSTIAAQGTALAGGLDVATGMLTRAGGAGRAILVVSDGEFHDDPTSLATSLDAVRAADIRVYSVGVGEVEGAPIPLPEGGFKKDRGGGLVLSKLDEDQLRHLALSTGGVYVRSVAGDGDVRGIYEGEIRKHQTDVEREVRREQIPHEQYQWPLGVALACLAVGAAFGMGPGRARRPALRPSAHRQAAGKAVALVLAVCIAPTTGWAGTKEDGLAAVKAQQWPAAIEALGQARVADPEDVEVGQALGEALYRAGRYRESEQVFTSLAAQDVDHRASHQYNAGSAAYKDGRLEQALRQFESSTAVDEKFESATKNAGAVRKEIELREKPPEEKEDPQEGDSGEGEKPEGGEPQAGQPESDETQGPSTEESGEPNDEALTPAEASRLVESVKEGRPRVAVGGRDTEKDW